MTAQLDLSQAPVNIWSFLNTLFGQRSGYVAVAIGRNPYRDLKGRYKHHDWDDHNYYQWPTDLDRMLNELKTLVGDTYFCPTLRTSMNRDKNGALPPTVCWVDLDGPAKDPALLETLQPLTVNSGSVAHRHLYVPLTREISLIEHEHINKRLTELLGGDSKWADNSLLRFPYTCNYKPTVPVNGQQPQQKTFVQISPTVPRHWDPMDLMMTLGLNFDGTVQTHQVIIPVVSHERVDLERLPQVVKDRLAVKDPDDRSAALYGLVGVCRGYGYTQGQTLTIASTWEPALAKYGERIDAEITRCWGKVDPPCEVQVELSPPSASNTLGNNTAVIGTAVQQPIRRRVELTAASTIKPKRVHWLWDGRMPLGELTLLAGREGIGKSTVCYQLASDVTRGMLPGEFKGQCRPVVVIATEDSWEHTIVPRLMAAGANTDMVFRAEVVTSDNIITGLSLPADTEMLKAQIKEVGAAMVLLDPLISRLDTKLDTHKDAEVRQALEPLVQLAHDCRVSVLGLIHVNKSGSTDPLNSVMGSKAFTAVARSVLYCIIDPEDETEQRKLLGMPKNNLGRQDLPTLTFEIENTYVCESDEGPIYSGAIKWGEELTRALRDVLETSQRGSEERTAVSEAAGWLEDYLKGCSNGCMSKEAKKEGVKAGHSRSAIERAAKRLPITIKSEGYPRQTWWRWIPDEDRGESVLSGDDPFFFSHVTDPLETLS